MVVIKMRKILKNKYGSAVPLILFILTILVCGALYTLFMVEVAYPSLLWMIPDSDSKTFIMMGMYAIPLFVLFIGVFSLIKAGVKENWMQGGGY